MSAHHLREMENLVTDPYEETPEQRKKRIQEDYKILLEKEFDQANKLYNRLRVSTSPESS